VLDTLRDELLRDDTPADRDQLTRRAIALLETEATRVSKPRLRKVINATGVVLHTNLGRAPLGDEVLRHVANVARGYASLEYDLATGRRGHRDRLVSELCASLVGAEDALVVNNNAAAVLLVATALGSGREVIVSRGELVEIGGGFRVPEILASCGARMVEVGTTNRTSLADYANAITPDTAMLLKVHRSNFAITGFTADVSLRDLAPLARERSLPLIEDLGSGALVDTASMGLPHEPGARASIEAGADLVMFSGDKLLGGPQAGIIVGRKSLVDRLRRHPLARAMRPGRIVFAALEATLRIYAEGRAAEAIPVVAMLAQSSDAVKQRAEKLGKLVEDRLASGPPGRRVTFAIEKTEARVGGGAMPSARIESWALVVAPEGDALAVALERALREQTDPPVVALVRDARVWLDARTIADEEIAATARGLARALHAIQEEYAGAAKEPPGGKDDAHGDDDEEG
jgi:L-seryl-tRNA(Ser) seleniumtransferase